MRLRLRWMLACVAWGWMPLISAAQSTADYPRRPIRLIVPYLPGGSTDILARLMTPRLVANLKQQIVIENRAGGGGNLGTDVAARATADGYTLLMAISSIVTAPAVNPKAGYDAIHDFTPLLLIAKSPYRVVINPAVPVNTLQEWYALAKSKPGAMNYGTAGTGSGVHLAVEYFKIMSGVNIVHVPYKGSPPAMADLIGGQIQMMFGGTLSTQSYTRAGRLKALAVTSLTRRADSPELPTIAESIVPGFEAGEWFGVFAPAGLPIALRSKIHREFMRVLNEPEVRQRMTSDGMDWAAGTPDEFALFLRNEQIKWARVVKETHISAN